MAEESLGATFVPTLSESGRPDAAVSTASGDSAPIAQEAAGRYTLLGELGRGAQSVVYLARDEFLGSEIAFKSLRPGPDGSFDHMAVTRFIREARVTAQLAHPGVAPVHEVGRRADGTYYATQKLIRGQTFASMLAGAKGLEERLRLLAPFLQLARAVAFAHGKGVIHRDLKPGNAMIGDLGEAVVLDWGLARTRGFEDGAGTSVESLLGDAGQTRAGVVLGTPAYMSPEQARGLVDQVGRHSDVWSLGVMLYEVLTHRLPFSGTQDEVLRQVSSGRALPVREVCPEAPAELAAIVERSLRPAPAERYPTAREFAEDLEAWLVGRRVQAYEYSSLELLSRFWRRNRTATAIASVLLVSLLALSVMWRYQAASARHLLSGSMRDRAVEAEHQRKYREAAALFGASRLHEDSVEAQLGVARVEKLAPVLLSKLDLDKTDCVADASKAETVMFLGERPLLACHRDGGIIGVDLTTGDVAWAVELGAGSSPFRAAPLRGRGFLAFETPDGQLRIHDDLPGLPARATTYTLPRGGRYSTPSLSDDATRMALTTVVGADAGLFVFELGTDDPVFHVDLAWPPGRGPLVKTAAIRGDGKRVAALAEDGLIAEWELPSSKPLRTFQVNDYLIYLEYAPDGTLLATSFKNLVVIQPDDLQFTADAEVVTSIHVSADGSRMATSGQDGTARVWDFPTREVARFDIINTSAWSSFVALSPRAERLILRRPNASTVELYELPRSVEVPQILPAHAVPVAIGKFSADGSLLVQVVFPPAGGMATVEVVDVDRGSTVASLEYVPSTAIRTQYGFTIAVSASNKRVAMAGPGPAEARVIDLDSRTSYPIAAPLLFFSLSPDGQLLAGATVTTLSVYESESGRPLWSRPFTTNDLPLMISERLLALTSALDCRVSLLDSRTGAVVAEGFVAPAEAGPQLEFPAIAASRDGRTLATACGEWLSIWDVPGLELRNRFKLGRAGPHFGFAMSGDGSLVAVADADVIAVHDAQTGTRVAQIDTSPVWHWTLGFSADGRRLRYIDRGQPVTLEVVPASVVAPAEALVALEHRLNVSVDPGGAVRDGPVPAVLSPGSRAARAEP